MFDALFDTVSSFFDTVSMFVQYIVHAIQHLLFFLSSLAQGIRFMVESFTFLPLFFAPIVSVVLGVMVIRGILSKE